MSLDGVRNRIVNAILISCSVIGGPAVVALAARASDTGLDPVFYVDVWCYAVTVATTIARRRLPLSVRGGVLLVLVVVDAVANLTTMGVAGMAPLVLCAGALTAAHLFGSRSGWAFLLLGLLLIGGVGAAISSSALELGVDIDSYARRPSTWALQFVAFGFIAAAMLIAQTRVTFALSSIIAQLRQQTTALTAANAELARSRDDAQAANRSKDRFIANLSHELRTPLSGIIGCADLLSEGAVAGDERSCQLETLRQSATSLETSIDHLLDAARVSGHPPLVELAPVSPRQVLQRAMTAAWSPPGSRAVPFELHVAASVPGIILTCPQRLASGLRHVLDNARRYSDAGGVRVTLSAPEGESRLLIEIVDAGAGIPAAEMDRLWKPFEQLTMGSEGRGGVGLGLAIARHDIESLGGTVEIESYLGVGTTVRLSVPYEAIAGALEAGDSTELVISRSIPPPAVTSRGLTDDTRRRLASAVHSGDYYQLRELLGQVDGQSPDAAAHLRTLIDAFDYAAIEHWLAATAEAGTS